MLRELLKYAKQVFILMVFYSSMTSCHNSNTTGAKKSTIDSFKVDYSGNYKVCDTCESILIVGNNKGTMGNGPEVMFGQEYLSQAIIKKYDSIYKNSKRKYFQNGRDTIVDESQPCYRFPYLEFTFYSPINYKELWCKTKTCNVNFKADSFCSTESNVYVVKGKFVSVAESKDWDCPKLVFKMEGYKYFCQDTNVFKKIEDLKSKKESFKKYFN